MIGTATKKPVTINFCLWSGDNLDEVMRFCSGNATYELMFRGNSEIVIQTLEDGRDKIARIRCAMDEAPAEPLNGTVEVDEVYIGGKLRHKGQYKERGLRYKYPVLAMLQRGGRVKTKPMATINGDNLKQTLLAHVSTDANLMTDESPLYRRPGKQFASHQTVNHSREEYARGDVTTNRVEGFFSVMRRGLHGIYHSVSREHLPKYLAEYEFRYNHRELSDGERVKQVIRSSRGKRLTYEASKA